MLSYKLVFNFCTTSALTLTLFSASVMAQDETVKDLIRQLDAAVIKYGFYNQASDFDTVNSLLARGARPDIKNLSHAAYYKRPDLVDRLLEFPIDVNQVAPETRETVLITALKYGENPQVSADELQVVESLLKAGANPNVIVHSGTTTPLMAALEGQRYPQPDLIRMLLHYGADPKLTTPKGGSPLMGRGASSIEVIKLLTAAGTDPYGVSKAALTPLHFVCERAFQLAGHPDPQAAERIALLHKKGTSIDALSPQQETLPIGTPLWENSRSHNPDCIKALMDAGASKDAPAFTPEYVAILPELKGQTVRERVLKSAKRSPILYPEAVLKLFE